MSRDDQKKNRTSAVAFQGNMAKLLKESSYLYFSVYFDIRTSYYHQENTWKLKMKDVINFFRFDFFGLESPEEKIDKRWFLF